MVEHRRAPTVTTWVRINAGSRCACKVLILILAQNNLLFILTRLWCSMLKENFQAGMQLHHNGEDFIQEKQWHHERPYKKPHANNQSIASRQSVMTSWSSLCKDSQSCWTKCWSQRQTMLDLLSVWTEISMKSTAGLIQKMKAIIPNKAYMSWWALPCYHLLPWG